MKMTKTINLVNTHAPAPAVTADKSWNKKLLNGTLTAVILALASTGAYAFDFSGDNSDWSGRFDTTISYGASGGPVIWIRIMSVKPITIPSTPG